MTSKLDYLQKYLAKPGGRDSCDSGKPVPSLSSKATKDKKKSRTSALQDKSSIKIRDLSEALPVRRDDSKKGRLAHLGLDVEEDVEVMDKDLVEAAQKVDAETSGIKWNIKQHRKVAPFRPAVRVKADPDGGDLSPPRGRAPAKQDADSDLSPPRAGGAPNVKREAGSDSDMSPPRGPTASKATKASAPSKPNIKKEEPSDSDMSPPRAAPRGGAPVKREAADSDADLSPPRNAGGGAAKRKVRHDSDADLSPPRQAAGGAAKRKVRHDSDADLSPPRQAAGGEAKRRQRHDSDSDLSPPRVKTEPKQRHDSDADLSPPRQAGGGAAAASGRRQRHDSDSDLSPPRAAASSGGGADNGFGTGEEQKMSSGLNSGLIKGEVLKAEAANLREKRKEALAAAPDSETGRGATTVYRSKDTGSLTTREEFAKQQTRKKKKKLSDYPEQELEWGGGLKQKHNDEEERAELTRIAAQPFARYEVDEKHMETLAKKSDWNDPMRKFEEQEDVMVANASSKTSAPSKPKPKCPHAPWLNRFGILPGYRWDGKIRGNSYEKRWLENKNHQEFKKKEAWMYSEMNS